MVPTVDLAEFQNQLLHHRFLRHSYDSIDGVLLFPFQFSILRLLISRRVRIATVTEIDIVVGAEGHGKKERFGATRRLRK
jgi:hypothetical protein